MQSIDYTNRYTKLESTGSLQNIIDNPDTNADRPLLDEDIRKAIDSLKASTAMIQKQKQILASQCDNIDKELRRKSEREVRRNTGIEHLRQRYKSERQSTNAVVVIALDLKPRCLADLYACSLLNWLRK